MWNLTGRWSERLIRRCLVLLLLCLGTVAHGLERIRYYVNDPLGSPIMVLDADGAVVARYAYAPFGSQVPAQSAGRQHLGFVGGIRETPGLHYLKNRYYNPHLGRFYQPDMVGFFDGGMRQINRYVYGLNDPGFYTDSNGFMAAPVVLPCGETCGSYVSANAASGLYHSYTDVETEANIREAQYYQQIELGSTAQGRFLDYAIADALHQASRRAIRILSNQVDRYISAGVANRLPDSALVCRGGACTADRFANGSGVSIDASGNLQGVSVNSFPRGTLKQLTIGIPNRQVGVTTVGDIRRAGGDVIPSPRCAGSPHCTMSGISPSVAEKLFTPTVANPNR